MELLIVVAIIAILVAVSIPIFTSQLEKAREATDVANMRAAKAVAVATYLAGDTNHTAGAAITDTYYDAVNGVLTTTKPTGYGKGTATDAKTVYGNYTSTESYVDKVITVDVTEAGVVTIDWE